MVWKANYARISSLPIPIGSLEELCKIIVYEVEDRGEASAKIDYKKESNAFNRRYHFAGAVFEERCFLSDNEEDELIETGIANLRYLLPQYVLHNLEGNIRIHKKSSKQ